MKVDINHLKACLDFINAVDSVDFKEIEWMDGLTELVPSQTSIEGANDEGALNHEFPQHAEWTRQEPQEDFVPCISLEDTPNSLDEVLTLVSDGKSNICDMNRPYLGQSHTGSGTRGKQVVYGLTMRDIRDCFFKAIVYSCPTPNTMERIKKCWDYSNCIHEADKPKPTQYLLDNLDKYPLDKMELGILTIDDVYKAMEDCKGDYDVVAVSQNLTCEIEKAMGIFPNVTKLRTNYDSIFGTDASGSDS